MRDSVSIQQTRFRDLAAQRAPRRPGFLATVIRAPEGRDVLVKELQGLSESNGHFHFGALPSGEVEGSNRTYRSDDKLLEQGKILFRPDAWDAEHYPHVMGQSTR